MEFVTIHDLSRELNIPSRVVRYRLMNLIAEGKFKEHEDFRRDDFKDDQHFVWKINPMRFIQETALKPAPPLTAVNEVGKQPMPLVNQSVNAKPPAGNEVQPSATKAENNAPVEDGERSLARELIDVLKEQLHVKDTQLREQGEQLKDEHELNLKLTGTMLQQAQKIENLLRLTSGEPESPDVVIDSDQSGNETVNQGSSVDNKTRNRSAVAG